MNVYNYAAGNPVNNSDPSGLEWLPDGTYVPDYNVNGYTAINRPVIPDRVIYSGSNINVNASIPNSQVSKPNTIQVGVNFSGQYAAGPGVGVSVSVGFVHDARGDLGLYGTIHYGIAAGTPGITGGIEVIKSNARMHDDLDGQGIGVLLDAAALLRASSTFGSGLTADNYRVVAVGAGMGGGIGAKSLTGQTITSTIGFIHDRPPTVRYKPMIKPSAKYAQFKFN